MNKQIILNKHLNGVEVGNSNESILNAMTEFAKQYHKEQLILSGVNHRRELLIADFIEKYNEGLTGNEKIHEDCLKDYLQGNL